MKGIVSQAKSNGNRPIWIGETLWAQMWVHWNTPEAQDKSATASNSRNSDRNGLGVHKHRSGQSSYLTIQQDMVILYLFFYLVVFSALPNVCYFLLQEEELGRPVSFGEVFKRTHTMPDGTYVDQKAKQVADTYDKTLQEVRDQAGDEPESSDTSEHSTQRQLSIDEQNDIFLKVFFSAALCLRTFPFSLLLLNGFCVNH